MTAYYNDSDHFAGQWLRNLIAAGHLAPGHFDQRSITDVGPDDVAGYDRVHLFAGIGGWDRALDLAGWANGPVWTGSCPCQPFSAAGKRKGAADERHLWPEMRRLIAECRPPVVFGEQVASRNGREWLAGVRTDLEALGYAVGAADLCAAGIGAPHIRQRLYWGAVRLDDADSGRLGGARLHVRPGGKVAASTDAGWASAADGVDDAERAGLERLAGHGDDRHEPGRLDALPAGSTAAAGGDGDFWTDFDVANLTDGTARRIEPGTSPLAHGVPARMGRLRGYGNAIVPQVAVTFVRSFIHAIGEMTVSEAA